MLYVIIYLSNEYRSLIYCLLKNKKAFQGKLFYQLDWLILPFHAQWHGNQYRYGIAYL